LTKAWQQEKPEFMHGHFSAEDLIKYKNQVVLFSNLFWKWKNPFADAVFAYHWFIYSLAKVKDITPEKINAQQKLWLKTIFSVPEIANKKRNKVLVKAALLERAIAGLLVDAFAYIDKENPAAEWLVAFTRKNVKQLTEELLLS
jgi:hypothetical protein